MSTVRLPGGETVDEFQNRLAHRHAQYMVEPEVQASRGGALNLLNFILNFCPTGLVERRLPDARDFENRKWEEIDNITSVT